MTKTVLLAHLRDWFEARNSTVALDNDAAGSSEWEVTIPGVAIRLLFRIIASLETGEATQLRVSAVIGAIVDQSAYRDILRRNVGGVGGSGFYFASMQVDDVEYLTFDSKLILASQVTLDDVTAVIEGWLLHPLLTRRWNFPRGVVNFIWDAAER